MSDHEEFGGPHLDLRVLRDPGKPPASSHQVGARFLRRAILGLGDSDEVLDALGWPWRPLCKRARDEPIAHWEDARSKRLRSVGRLLQNRDEGYQYRLEEILAWLELAQGEDLSMPESPFGETPMGSPSTLDDLLRSDHQPRWLIEGILEREGSTVLGGPSKSLKTTVLVDLCLSLASGRPFLGRWSVPHPVRVGLISAEDGWMTIAATARDIARAKGIDDPSKVSFTYWGDLPDISDSSQVGRLQEVLYKGGVEVLALDPLYLALRASGDVNSMFYMGRALDNLSCALQQVGTTALIVHHFTKDTGRRNAPPDLGSLAHAGVGQFARQWLLLSRRERYNPASDIQRLHFVHGASAGHSGAYHLDIDRSPLSDGCGRNWGVTISDPPARAERKSDGGDKQAAGRRGWPGRRSGGRPEVDQQDIAAVLEAIQADGGRATTRRIRNATGWGAAKVDRVLNEMVRAGELRQTEISKLGRTHAGYELAIEAGRGQGEERRA